MATLNRPLGAALAVVAALVVAVGSVSGAGAAGALTDKAVKKIATKVVKKQAPHLAVDHANTAANAATAWRATTAATAQTASSAATAGLAGKVESWSFTVTDTGPATTHTITFPALPQGSYVASYSLAVNLAAGKTILCGFEPGSAAPSFSAAPAGDFTTVSGTALVTVGANFDLSCTATADFEINPYYGEVVTFVPAADTAGAAGGS